MDELLEKWNSFSYKEDGSSLTPVAVAAQVVGVLTLASIALGLVSSFYKVFLRPGKNLRKYGEWAVVTGATDGIGKAYSFELAKKGLNILLISRTEAKLADVQKEITTKYPKVKVDYVVVDFSNFDKAAQAKVSSAIGSLDVGVLVNNVGMSYPHPKYLWEVTEEEWEGLLALNVDSTVTMIRLALPAMKDRRRGCIINLASAAARNPTSLLSGYSGAKGFVLKLSESMHYELAPFGIHVQCQVPLLVATKLAKIRRASLTVPSPSNYAKSAIRAIGYEPTVCPYWSHRMQAWAMDTLPFYLVNKVVTGMHTGLRKKALKKAQAKSD